MLGDIETAVAASLARFGESERRDRPIDLVGESARFVLDTVMRALFGEILADRLDSVCGDVITLTQEVGRANRDPLRIRRLWQRSASREFPTALERMRALCDHMLEARRRGNESRSALLGLLVEAMEGRGRAQLTPEQARDEVMNYLFSGYETMAATLVWTLYLIAAHEPAQRQVTVEIDRTLGGRPLAFEGLKGLGYTDTILSESLRLCPPVWMTARSALAAHRIGEVDVPQGATVLICILAIHRSPRFWDDPMSFKPERFLPEWMQARPHYAYFPFGGGPRSCIGARFGRLAILSFIAALLQRYRLTPMRPGWPRFDCATTLRAVGPIPVRLNPRT